MKAFIQNYFIVVILSIIHADVSVVEGEFGEVDVSS